MQSCVISVITQTFSWFFFWIGIEMDGMASTLAWPDKLPNLKVIIGCVYATAYRWPKKEILKDDLRENPQSAKIANFIAALFIETDTETFVETKLYHLHKYTYRSHWGREYYLRRRGETSRVFTRSPVSATGFSVSRMWQEVGQGWTGKVIVLCMRFMNICQIGDILSQV